MKQLVTYFSATGTTARVAATLAEAIGADVFEIRPREPYTPEDLDWWNPVSRSSLEMKDPASRPGIGRRLENMEAYDRIYVGFPIWWSVAPRIVKTFLEGYDFAGRQVIPFATSGGTGPEKIYDDLAPSCPGADLKQGSLLQGDADFKTLADWAETV